MICAKPDQNRPQRVGTGSATANTIAQGQVMDALKSGQFTATDGPALRIAIDTDGDGRIGAADIPMGGDLSEAPANVNVVVEWRSTPEFGRVATIDLYVGAFAASHGIGAVYAPRGHAARPRFAPGTAGITYTDGAGVTYDVLQDGYHVDRTGKLRITVPAASGFEGRHVVTIRRGDYPLFDRVCEKHEEPVEGYFDELNGERVPPRTAWVTSCAATNVANPERLFVRALAITAATETIPAPAGGVMEVLSPRLAYANPMWIAFSAPPVLPRK